MYICPTQEDFILVRKNSLKLVAVLMPLACRFTPVSQNKGVLSFVDYQHLEVYRIFDDQLGQTVPILEMGATNIKQSNFES